MKPLWLLYLMIFSSCILAQDIPYGDNARAGRFYHLRGLDFYTEEYGAGKPLVLLHGNGGSISSMAGIIPYFSQKYRTIAIDSRAHGKSIDVSDSLSFEMMADDVTSLLELMKIDSAYVIGWSDGGIVGLEMAMRHPEKIIKLASSGANLWPDSSALNPSVWKNDKDYYNARKNIPKITSQDKNSWKLFLLDWEQPNISLSDLKKISAPSLIISGDHDLISLDHTVSIYKSIPHAQLWILPNTGHGTLIEHPKEFFEKVNQFFQAE